MEYYYTKKENIDIEKKELVIDDFEFKHLVKVLRKSSGDKVTITDGERNIYYCEIRKIDSGKLVCEILSTDNNLNEPEINMALYISPLRNSSRFEFAVEKAVELGVTSVNPVITEFTINKNFKYDRLKKIIIGAMGQSQRCLLPELTEAVSFNKMLIESKDCLNKFVMYESSNDKIININKDSLNIMLLIGPEGGFSKNEISLLKENNWQVKSLGERKLRAETAAIVSVFKIISK